ncbi:TonB-dependent receptor plug domain-containing protein [Ketobacter alkanivorans]|uniref:TonB-dependent receptor n=1 Tax=Ketobacter alkanivorans TaxID=1917421 RepID=A0A2K9LJF4_9GAMM|nr:TonB-dependent receptor [Ketobacter alkanivorans]AUM12370.1 hypothetical protein Kalk_08045 [Ketobacter alkanivorans]
MGSLPTATTIITAVGLLLCCTAKAESRRFDDLVNLSLDELINIEITSSTRTSKTLKNVPSAATVFSQSELRSMGIDFLYELLNFVPGYQTSRDNDAGASYLYSSRGSDTGQQTSAILLLIDGIPRHEVRTSSASLLSSLMPIARIERIEVIRGPGSALYGSNAFLGVINIITVDSNNELALQVGQPDRQQLQAQISNNAGFWHFDAFLSGYQDKGQEYLLDDRLGDDLKTTQDPQAVSNFAFRLGYKDTQLSAEHINFESKDYYSVSAISNDVNEMRHYFNQITAKQAFELGNVHSLVQLSYSEENRNSQSQATNPGALAAISNPSSNAPLVGDVLFEADTTLAQWLNDWEITANTNMQFGLEWAKDDLRTARVLANYDTSMLSNRQYPVDYSPEGDIYNEVIETEDRVTKSAYSQLQHQWDSKTDLVLGIRYDNYSGFDDHISPRFALVRKLTENSSIKLLLAEAYRTPSFLQTFVKENLTVVRNPDLKAETIRTSELIWVTQKNQSTFTAGVFYNVIENRIDTATFSDGKRANINEDEEYSGGIELEAILPIGYRWSLRSNYTHFLKLPDASYRESERLASFILNYSHDSVTVNLGGYYNSERSMPPDEHGDRIDAVYALNGKIGFQVDRHTTINLQVKNILDDTVSSSPQSESIKTAIPYRGREVSIGFNYAF